MGVALAVEFEIGLDKTWADPGRFSPSAGSAQAWMTAAKSRSMVSLKGWWRSLETRRFGGRKWSMSKIARGSGDHQVSGSSVHGKIPER